MAIPALLKPKQRTPPTNATVDWSHPLVPACGWVPSLGYKTIHGDTVSMLAGTGSVQPGKHPAGPAWTPSTTGTYAGWPNRIGTPKGVTMAIWPFGAVATKDACMLSTSRTTALHCGLGHSDTAINWTMMWHDESTTWDYSGGPTPGGNQMIVGVYDSTVPNIKHYVNGSLQSTNTSVTATLVNFTTETWATGDVGLGTTFGIVAPSVFYLIWDRPLGAGEVAKLWADPWCWMRW